MKRVRLLDYGVGNIHSLKKALERAGLAVEVAPAARGAGDADGLVLPGVGAFAPAADALAPARDELLAALDGGMPALGVCLGMQLLCEGSVEGPGRGLGLLPGEVQLLQNPRLPHIGWNTIEGARGANDLATLEGRHVYYVHSYVLPSDVPGVIATSTYGDSFPAIVRTRNVLATQFHPEKSSDAGRLVLDAFARLVQEAA